MALLVQSFTPLMDANSLGALRLLLSYGANPAARSRFVSFLKSLSALSIVSAAKLYRLLLDNTQRLLALSLSMLQSQGPQQFGK